MDDNAKSGFMVKKFLYSISDGKKAIEIFGAHVFDS